MRAIDVLNPSAQPAKPREADVYRGAFGGFGEMVLARVTGYDFVTEDSGLLQRDENNNAIPTGRLEVEFIEKLGTRSKVPYVLPAAGNTVFMGGLPEINTVCVLAFRQQNRPVIVGFLPQGLDNLSQLRQQIPNLQPGELLMQSSSSGVMNNGDENFFRGARVHLDRYGRINVVGKGYELVTNFLLSDEFTPQVTRVTDPVTGNAVFFRETLGDQRVERRVDELGNAVATYAADQLDTVRGNRDISTEGTWTATAKRGITIQDENGNRVNISEDGQITLETKGNIDLKPGGTFLIETGGNFEQQVALRRQATIGEDDVVSVAGSMRHQVALDHELEVSTGFSMEDIIVGKKIIHALAGIDLETEAAIKLDALTLLKLFAATKVTIGSSSASQPFVNGTKLATAFSLVTPTGPGLIGIIGPVLDIIAPGTSVLLATWQLANFVVPGTSVNSLKIFGE